MTIKDLWRKIQGISQAHVHVNEVAEGDVYENLNSGEQQYPFVNWTVNSINRTDNTIVVGCYLFYIDRLLEDSSNKLDIWSVGVNTLQEILNRLTNGSDYVVIDDVNFTNFTEKFSELCAGVYASCNITIVNTIGECDSLVDNTNTGKLKFERNGRYLADGYERYEIEVAVPQSAEEMYDLGYQACYEDYKLDNIDYLSFKAIEPSTISMTVKGNKHVQLQYSLNKKDWTDWDLSEITLNIGDKIYMRGEMYNDLNSESWCKANFVMTGNIEASGNLFTIVNWIGSELKLAYGMNYNYNLFGLFEDCKALKTAPKLPIEKTVYYLYYKLFKNSGITAAPELPAQTLGQGVYESMFEGCESLTKAPVVLPATNITSAACYINMFRGAAIDYSPIIMATNYKDDGMFEGMFNNCANLKRITTLFSHVKTRNGICNMPNIEWYNIGLCDVDKNALFPNGCIEYRMTNA